MNNRTIEEINGQLLTTLHSGGVKWFAQRFTKDGKRRSVWFDVDGNWSRFNKHFERWKTGENVYFGINPTCTSVTDADRKKFTKGGETPKDSYIEQYIGSKNHTISAANCVFTEIDGKDFTFPSEDEIVAHIPAIRAEKQKMLDAGEFERLPSDKVIYNEAVGRAKQAKYITAPSHYNALALAHLKSAPLKASVCWCSGGGYQAVWLFDKTFVIDSQYAREMIQWLQFAWVGVVGGDDGAKDIRRILRLPGTQNVKKHWAPNYPTVSYEWADFDTTYSLDAIIAHVPPRPAQDEPKQHSTTNSTSNGAGNFKGESVIARFNATYKVTDILDDNGYTGQGTERSRPGAPSSNGVNISDDGFLSWHWSSNDPLYNPKADGNPHKTTSFTAFLQLEHSGNMREAVKAAAEMLGMGRDRDDYNQRSDAAIPVNNASQASNPAKRTVDAKTGEIIDDVPALTTLDGVLSAVEAIAGNTDMKPQERRKAIVSSLSSAIGAIDRSLHVEIVAALEAADTGFTRTSAKEFVQGCIADARKRSKAAARQRAEQARENLLAVRSKKGKASIDVGGRQLSDVVSEALQVLEQSNNARPRIFVRNGALSRIAQDERGFYGIQEIDDRALLHELSEVADWETVVIDVNGNPQSKPVDPPINAIREIFGRPGWPGFPALAGVVTSPVFSRDGALHDQPGYNPATRLYYTGGVSVGDTTPTPENIEHAKDLILNNLLVDFPFKDPASLAHAIAYMLLPYTRDMIDGPTPVHDVDSPTAGTGKGKLLSACAYPFLGHDVPTMAAAKDDDEWRKRITTTLMNGSTHLVIDNVNHELDSGSLASAFTQPVWEDRALGGNREVKIPIRTIWGITANNISMSQELARRCIWIRLDANVEKPWERREFKHKNLIGWAKANRDALVTAALTFIRAWIDRGMPRYTKHAKGSYEEWAGVMGGILEAVGISGFLENENELYERVVSKNDLLGDFVKEWWEVQHNRETARRAELSQKGKSEIEPCLSSYELFKLASTADDDEDNRRGGWYNLLGDVLNSPKQRGRQTQLGKILDSHVDKVVGEYKISLAKTANGSKFWMLKPALVEPQKQVLPGSTKPLPPVQPSFVDPLVEPHEPVSPRTCEKNIFLFPLNTAANNGEEKNITSIQQLGRKGSVGSTNNSENTASTGGSGLVEPQKQVLPETEVLPGIEVATWEL